MVGEFELLLLVATLLACGAAAGILAGLLGVGGGIVIVPMLYHVFAAHGLSVDVAMPLAVGTSLATIVLTSAVSARNHHRRGGIDMALARRWIVPVLAGVAGGMAAARFVPGGALRSLFGVLLVVVSVHLLLTARRRLSLRPTLPTMGVQRSLAVLVGGFSSLLGIGGGTLMVPLLSLFSFPIHRAVATASVFGIIIAVPATVGYLLAGAGAQGLPVASTGYVNWLAFAALVPATMAFAPVGVALAYRLQVVQLKRAFAVFLLLVGVKMLVA